jgi:drug/metabolite transporter (DMT)-like permease
MPDSHPTSGAARTSFAFAACTLIWGSTFLFIRIGNDSVPPMWAATIRLMLAALVMTGVVFATGRRMPAGGALRAALQYGTLQFGLNFPLLYWGETRVSSGLAAVVFATIPITSAFVARAFGLERLSRRKMIGAFIALGGVALLFQRDLGSWSSAAPLLAIFLATVAAALGSTLLKRGPRQDPMAANAVAAAAGAPLCLLASVLLGESRRLPTEWVQIYPIVYLALFGSVGAFVIFAWLLNRWPVSTLSFIGVVVPVIAVTLGALVRHERLFASHLLGTLLILAGVTLAIAGDPSVLRRRAPG